ASGSVLSPCQTTVGGCPVALVSALTMSISRFEPGNMMTAAFMGTRDGSWARPHRGVAHASVGLEPGRDRAIGRHAIGHEVGQGDLPEIERLSVGQEIALAYHVEDGADDERYPERAADDAAVEHDLEQRRLCGTAAGGGAHAG